MPALDEEPSDWTTIGVTCEEEEDGWFPDDPLASTWCPRAAEWSPRDSLCLSDSHHSFSSAKSTSSPTISLLINRPLSPGGELLAGGRVVIATDKPMASLQDITLAAVVNLCSALAFLIAFAILRLQPVNDRVYFPKWYLKGIRGSPSHSRGSVTKFINLDWRMYIRILNWMPEALRMPEPELIEHAGLDSVAFIRIYLLGLKIFVPIAVLAFLVLVPVNMSGKMLDHVKDLLYSDIDKLSLSNIPPRSNRFWAHIVMAYVFTFWTFYMLYKEYRIIMTMRLRFLASVDRRPDQFTVSVLEEICVI
ncbi:hypothetical protein Dimus_018845 [Dionaea muscipula]